MFAGVGRELGIGPAIRLNQAAAYELLEQDPYARARFHVRFRVPQGWNHVGLLGVKHLDVREGWFYPNRPGAVHDTWADGSEFKGNWEENKITGYGIYTWEDGRIYEGREAAKNIGA